MAKLLDFLRTHPGFSAFLLEHLFYGFVLFLAAIMYAIYVSAFGERLGEGAFIFLCMVAMIILTGFVLPIAMVIYGRRAKRAQAAPKE